MFYSATMAHMLDNWFVFYVPLNVGLALVVHLPSVCHVKMVIIWMLQFVEHNVQTIIHTKMP